MTDKRVAAFIVNFNMVERADALAEYIRANVKTPVDVIVIDNGSDLKPPSVHTSLRIAENIQTTGGWLMGLQYADHLARKRESPYFAYWFLITSAEFVTGDPLTPMVELLERYGHAVGVHPALTPDSTTSWQHLKKQMSAGFRQTWMIDNIASLYRADWFDRNGRFDPELRYAWGIDIETCWRARKHGRTLWISEGVPVKKVTDIGYSMGRMNMSAEDRQKKAGDNMREVLSARYGSEWWSKMLNEYRQ